MPAAHEPAFIVNSRLGPDTAVDAKPANDPHLASDESRSTSEGSASPLQSVKDGALECSGLPDYDYPVPFVVRNTFIETGPRRPLSLDEFYEERRVHSCPMESPFGFSSGDERQMPQGMPSNTVMDSVATAAAAASAAAAAAAMCWMRPVMGSQMVARWGMQPEAGFATPTSPAPRENVPVLRLADCQILEPPVANLGSPEMPTVGSAGHHMGNCKPCAFFHTKGCGNGTQCSFCHLCPSGEKKRRQKEKGAAMRDMKRMGLA